MVTLPHIPASPLPMPQIIALLQWILPKDTSPSLAKAFGQRRKSLSQSTSTTFQTSSANSPSSILRNSTSGSNPAAIYTLTIWVASLFVPESETTTLCLPIILTPTPSSSHRSNNAMTAITFLFKIASCLASSPKATALISKSSATRPEPSIVAPSLKIGNALYRLSRLMSIVAT